MPWTGGQTESTVTSLTKQSRHDSLPFCRPRIMV